VTIALTIILTDMCKLFLSCYSDKEEDIGPVNGFALWAVWKVGGKAMSAGPLQEPSVGEIVDWDTHTRQAVKILVSTGLLF
jgi:hypothetical protein